jgi:hypothetical protein
VRSVVASWWLIDNGGGSGGQRHTTPTLPPLTPIAPRCAYVLCTWNASRSSPSGKCGDSGEGLSDGWPIKDVAF